VPFDLQEKDIMIRIGIGVVVLAAVAAVGASMAAQRAAATPTIEVYKTPTCGCCGNWVTHLEEHGFTTHVTDLDDLSDLKASHGVPARAQSCHTAIVDGYVIEGHVPAADVRRLLKERPQVAGLAVPGMPIGSPGMEYGTTVQPYDVLTFDAAGQLQVYSSYGR
jgi:hypothetical protein